MANSNYQALEDYRAQLPLWHPLTPLTSVGASACYAFTLGDPKLDACGIVIEVITRLVICCLLPILAFLAICYIPIGLICLGVDRLLNYASMPPLGVQDIPDYRVTTPASPPVDIVDQAKRQEGALSHRDEYLKIPLKINAYLEALGADIPPQKYMDDKYNRLPFFFIGNLSSQQIREINKLIEDWREHQKSHGSISVASCYDYIDDLSLYKDDIHLEAGLERWVERFELQKLRLPAMEHYWAIMRACRRSLMKKYKDYHPEADEEDVKKKFYSDKPWWEVPPDLKKQEVLEISTALQQNLLRKKNQDALLADYKREMSVYVRDLNLSGAIEGWLRDAFVPDAKQRRNITDQFERLKDKVTKIPEHPESICSKLFRELGENYLEFYGLEIHALSGFGGRHGTKYTEDAEELQTRVDALHPKVFAVHLHLDYLRMIGKIDGSDKSFPKIVHTAPVPPPPSQPQPSKTPIFNFGAFFGPKNTNSPSNSNSSLPTHEKDIFYKLAQVTNKSEEEERRGVVDEIRKIYNTDQNFFPCLMQSLAGHYHERYQQTLEAPDRLIKERSTFEEKWDDVQEKWPHQYQLTNKEKLGKSKFEQDALEKNKTQELRVKRQNELQKYSDLISEKNKQLKEILEKEIPQLETILNNIYWLNQASLSNVIPKSKMLDELVEGYLIDLQSGRVSGGYAEVYASYSREGKLPSLSLKKSCSEIYSGNESKGDDFWSYRDKSNRDLYNQSRGLPFYNLKRVPQELKGYTF